MPETKSHETLLLGDGSDDIRSLTEEYARLRQEVEALRMEQKKLIDEKPKDQRGKDRGDEKKDDKKGDAGDEKGEKDEKSEKKEDDQPKPPIRERAGNWVRDHPLGLVATIVGFVALVIVGVILWRYLASFESTDDAEVEGHISQISSRIAGTVVAVHVENAQNIKQGEVLVELDPKDYSVSVAQARANLAQAQAGVEVQNPSVPITTTTQNTQVQNADQDVLSAQAALAAAERSYESSLADVRQAEANYANASVEEVRYRQLVNKDEVSREQYDQRVTAAKAQDALASSRRESAAASLKMVDERKAQLSQAREKAEEARANMPRQLEIQHASVRSRQAAAKAAQAQLDQALLNLTYVKIIAPADGIIGDRTVEPGMQVSPGQEMLAVTRLDDIWVTANFKETQLGKMHAGQPVTIHVDMLEQDFDGYIENLPGATGAIYSLLPPENATGNYVKVVQRLPVRIRFKPNQKNGNRLRPGMSVEPKVWVEQ